MVVELLVGCHLFYCYVTFLMADGMADAALPTLGHDSTKPEPSEKIWFTTVLICSNFTFTHTTLCVSGLLNNVQ